LDYVSIRGVRLELDELVDRHMTAPSLQGQLHRRLQEALPFPYLVIDGLFNPRLLELIAEEFDQTRAETWARIKSSYEETRRSVLGSRLGPATQLYFNVVNSGWFVQWLSGVVGIPDLLTDPKLFGGGLHECRPGGSFAVHRDFQYHRHLGLKNQMVFITYLNKGWQPEWGSALELWDEERHECVAKVQPEFGRTLLLPHGPKSFHGHPTPFFTPDGRTRRSVAAYYYTNPTAGEISRSDDVARDASLGGMAGLTLKRYVRALTPPILWRGAQRK
jgi:Rps23 Pro-64 3,4-dihydroxylase Tpa1-like proline 4-hydroxylase